MRQNTGHRNQKTVKGPTWKRANLVNPDKGRELILRASKHEIDKEMRRLSKLSSVTDEDVDKGLVRDILVRIIQTHHIPTATHNAITEADIQELNDYYTRALGRVL